MRREMLICAVLAAATLAVYWPVGHHDFVCYDDHLFVAQNPYVQAGLTLQSIRYALAASIANNWHPVTTLSHIMDCELFGVRPGPHHLVNAAIHAANVVLLFLLLGRMTGLAWRSALVAALFGLHPLHVESVAWIAERKDVLSTFFGFLTLLAYSKYVKQSQVWSLKSKVGNTEHRTSNLQRRTSNIEPAPSDGSEFEVGCSTCGVRRSKSQASGPWMCYFIALLAFALGLMSKPMLVTLPFVLLLLDYWPLGRVAAKAESKVQCLLSEKLPFFALSAASSWITVRLKGRTGGIAAFSEMSLGERVANAVASYLQYLAKMFWPTRLAVLYPHPAHHYPVSDPWPVWQICAGALLLAATSALCIFQLRSRPWLAVGWFWYIGTLVPVIGLVQAGEQAMADRYTYVPLIGLFIAAVWGVSEAANEFCWRRRKEALTPGSALPIGSGPARDEGQPRADEDAAAPSLGQPGLAVLSSVVLTACVILTHRQLGYWQNTVTLFEHTLEITPDNPVAQFILGVGLMEAGEPSMGATRFRAALAIAPSNTLAHINLGAALKKLDALPEAAEEYLAVTRLAPDYLSGHLALVGILPRLGRGKEAVVHMDEALRIYADPRFGPPDSGTRQMTANFLNDLAWTLATNPAPENRNGAQAVRFAERACELTQYQQTIMVGTLAAAYAEAGRFPEAVATAQNACGLGVTSGEEALAQRNRELLELYRSGKPYREQ